MSRVRSLLMSTLMVALCPAVSVEAATVQEVLASLPDYDVSAFAELGGNGGIENTGAQSALSILRDGAATAWGTATQTSAFAYATDDGPSPRARAIATGGGRFVIGDSNGQVIEYSGDLVARLQIWIAVGAGDKPTGPGSLHGFTAAGFNSGPISGGLNLSTHITTPDTLVIVGLLADLVGDNQTTEDGVNQTNFGGYGQTTSVSNGVGLLSFSVNARGSDTTNILNDHMPGPAFGVAGIGFAGFERSIGDPLPEDATIYFASGETFSIDDPDLGTTPIDLPTNPFPDPPIPEPGSLALLSALGMLVGLRRSHKQPRTT